jgi:tRNA G18 (ribose-2'-O)-methylase SpoU
MQPPNAAAAGNNLLEAELPKSYLLVHNVSKKHNIGTLSRSCTAFGVTQVCIVGQNAYNTFGSHGAAEHVDIRHFWKLEDAAKYLKVRTFKVGDLV